MNRRISRKLRKWAVRTATKDAVMVQDGTGAPIRWQPQSWKSLYRISKHLYAQDPVFRRAVRSAR